MYLYTITNLIDNKKYAGITNNFKRRWREHRSELNSNRHGNPHLQNAWELYGVGNFIFKIINKFNNLDDLNKAEINYIKNNNLQNPNIGYNLSNGGNTFEHTDQAKKKIAKSNIKAVICMNIKTKKVKIYNKISDVKYDGFNNKNIGSCCVLKKYGSRNKVLKKHITHKQHVWMYLEDYLVNPSELSRRCNLGINTKARPMNYKPIVGMNIKTKQLIYYDATSYATKDGFNKNSIRSCCVDPQTHKTHRGYIWVFRENIDQLDIRLKNALNKKTHKIRNRSNHGST